MSLRCFIQTQYPVPGSAAQPVRYPACEWLDDDGAVHHEHPLNRFVCSWLSSDMAQLPRCDETLDKITQLQAHELHKWFADGEMFCLEFNSTEVQFNQSNVSPVDANWWNLSDARFVLEDLKSILQTWREFLAKLYLL